MSMIFPIAVILTILAVLIFALAKLFQWIEDTFDMDEYDFVFGVIGFIIGIVVACFIGYYSISNIKHHLGWMTFGKMIAETEEYCVTVQLKDVGAFDEAICVYRVYNEDQWFPVEEFTAYGTPTCEFGEKKILPYKIRENARKNEENLYDKYQKEIDALECN